MACLKIGGWLLAGAATALVCRYLRQSKLLDNGLTARVGLNSTSIPTWPGDDESIGFTGVGRRPHVR